MNSPKTSKRIRIGDGDEESIIEEVYDIQTGEVLSSRVLEENETTVAAEPGTQKNEADTQESTPRRKTGPVKSILSAEELLELAGKELHERVYEKVDLILEEISSTARKNPLKGICSYSMDMSQPSAETILKTVIRSLRDLKYRVKKFEEEDKKIRVEIKWPTKRRKKREEKKEERKEVASPKAPTPRKKAHVAEEEEMVFDFPKKKGS